MVSAPRTAKSRDMVQGDVSSDDSGKDYNPEKEGSDSVTSLFSGHGLIDTAHGFRDTPGSKTVELGRIRSSVPLRQLHIYTLAPRVPLISDPLPESAHGQPR